MRFLFALMMCLLLQNTFGQLNCKTSKKIDTTIVKCFHVNGKISVWKENYNDRTGKVTAYDNSGKIIFEFYTRSFSGHAYADIEYYKNGQVKKVYYSSAPDAGIQWYNITIYFDENGKETGRSEQSNEHLLRPTLPIYFKDSIRILSPQKIDSSKWFITEYYLINVSNLTYKLINKLDTASPKSVLLIKPKDTLFLQKEYHQYKFNSINREPTLTVYNNKKSKKKHTIFVGELVNVNTKLRRQYFLLF
jgi:hypothetical protein